LAFVGAKKPHPIFGTQPQLPRPKKRKQPGGAYWVGAVESVFLIDTCWKRND
jgi:hypothetical protein